MQILRDYDLTNLNTFGVSARAKFFVEIKNEEELGELFKREEFSAKGGSASGGTNNRKIFLGGGSNVLFTKDFDGIVILNKLKGIEILSEDVESVVIRAMSGVVWHDLVIFAVERGYWGIENLSFIPGTVGAAPMQNIGAYGAELAQVLESVETYEISDGQENQKRIFSKEECELGYRDSIFKNELKNKYFISAITLRLSKVEQKNISYKVLQTHLTENKIEVKHPRDVSDAVTHIRKTKLPNPNIIGNAGSFFKNIFLSKEKAETFLKKYPEAPYFKEDEMVKIPAAWLVEQSGPRNGGASWKGYKIGNAGVHDKQALVIVNHGGATGEEIKNLAGEIIASVKDKFGLELVPEVNLIE